MRGLSLLGGWEIGATVGVNKEMALMLEESGGPLVLLEEGAHLLNNGGGRK